MKTIGQKKENNSVCTIKSAIEEMVEKGFNLLLHFDKGRTPIGYLIPKGATKGSQKFDKMRSFDATLVGFGVTAEQQSLSDEDLFQKAYMSGQTSAYAREEGGIELFAEIVSKEFVSEGSEATVHLLEDKMIAFIERSDGPQEIEVRAGATSWCAEPKPEDTTMEAAGQTAEKLKEKVLAKNVSREKVEANDGIPF